MTVFASWFDLNPDALGAQKAMNRYLNLTITACIRQREEWRRAHRVYARLERWGA